MKTLIVYFSLDGNTKWIAEKVQEKLPNATLHTIELAKEPLRSKWLRMMVYGFKTTFYRDMEIAKSNLDMAEFDSIIIGSPVWVGNVPPPVKAFIKQNPIVGKRVAAFCSMGGEPSRFFHKLREYIGINLLSATLAMVDPLQNMTEENIGRIDDFAVEVRNAFESKTAIKIKA